MKTTFIKITCDRCNLLFINKTACHEHGCPNEKKKWLNGQWVAVYQCDICGYDVEQGEICSCYDETPNE